jgi:pseudouridylate synthase
VTSVALESTVFSTLGLPPPWGAAAYRRAIAAVEAAGAKPLVIAIVDGEVRTSVDERVLFTRTARKAAERDVPIAVAQRWPLAATTVSATLAIAADAGIAVFATGGVGGVHRDATRTGDVSGDLDAIARHPVVTVCAGAKGFLDLPRTLEHLEMLGVSVVGFGTDELPAFWCRTSGLALPHSVANAEELAAIARVRRQRGLLVCVPCPEDAALPRDVVEPAITAALADAEREGVTGSAVTPFVLTRLADELGDAVLDANVALVERNAQVAGEIAVALAGS